MNDLCIEIEALSLQFGLTRALDEVSSQVPPGEIVGLIGRNGAGKTTLLESLAGLILPDSGHSRLFGHDSRRLPDSVRQQLGFVFQQDELFGWMRVADHIAAVGAHYENWDSSRADDLAGRWSIPLKVRVDSLSRGQRQKLAILLAIVHQPRLLLLDEPASALDPMSRRAFLTELIELACDRSPTMVLSSHLLGDIERLASRIWIMHNGRLVIDESLDALKEGLIRLDYRGPDAERFPSVPGTISRRLEESDLTVVTRRPDSKRIECLRKEFGHHLQVTPMNLEQIALELL